MKSVKLFYVVFAILTGIAVLFFLLKKVPDHSIGGPADEESHEESEHDAHGEHGAHEEHDGHLKINAEALDRSGIVLDTAKPRRMAVTLSLQGRIVPNESRLAHLHARFPGVIREVLKQLGEKARKGEALAVVESNESMQAYSVITQFDGTVIEKHAAVGETVSDREELFTVADLSTVWVDFQAYRQDFPRLRRGQRVRVEAEDGYGAETVLNYLSPVSEEHTQTLLVRAALDNRDGRWPPGLFVKGSVAVELFDAGVAVRLEGVQTLEGKTVVFARDGDHFETREVRLGRRDGDYVEVLEGVGAGETYASRNSFILKADLGKGEAEHEH